MAYLLRERPTFQTVITIVQTMDLRVRKVQQLVIDLIKTQTPGLISELLLAALLNLPKGSPWTTTQDTLGQSLVARAMEEGLAGASSVMRMRMMALTLSLPDSIHPVACWAETRRDNLRDESQRPGRQVVGGHWTAAPRKDGPETLNPGLRLMALPATSPLVSRTDGIFTRALGREV